MNWLSEQDCVARLKSRPMMGTPFLVYSTLLGGWTDSPLGLVVGMDDHGFHRGDGVFEAIRIIKRKPWLLKPHWDRLQISLKLVDIKLELSFEEVEAIINKGLERMVEEDGLIRMFVTRGPGGFSPDVRECVGAQFFCVLVRTKSQPEEKFQKGVKLGKSPVPVKPGWQAITKSLNYLPNVMMKKDSVERGLDFTVSFDEQNRVAESATENLVVLMKDGSLAHPKLARILKGCTMMRLFELVEQSKLVPVKGEVELTEKDLFDAQGLYMVGSTLDVLPVNEYEGKPIPLSPLGVKFRELILKDQGLL